jgi:hypothetical protein
VDAFPVYGHCLKPSSAHGGRQWAARRTADHRAGIRMPAAQIPDAASCVPAMQPLALAGQHLFHLAHGFYRERRDDFLFLRAERRPDGSRTFRISAGEPLPTSHGEDVYRSIFGVAAETG